EWLDLIDDKPIPIQTEIFQSILSYALKGVELDISEEAQTVFKMIKPSIKKRKQQSKAVLEERRQEFIDSLIPFINTHGRELLRAFYNYWSELNKSGTKMRFELEKTWELSRRLTTWKRNNERNSTNTFAVAKTIEQGVERKTEEASWINGISIGR
ncbi:MAG: DUF6291 domain-containing protein, partial [Phocaeicola sp.]